ncbi:MAG: hypothetical protein Q7T48_23900 [Cellvibrio sp.]|uniref:hypothetical protein n=1 Tax=Cellvibrio sp. TaxID=1965322 RepID=UPI00271AE1E9|nr:hypothetical protein [Cellvibrio sp.]
MKLLAVLWLGLCVAIPVFADDNCEAAVDAADSMNVNQDDCDYSDKGLNGFLQKAFKKGSEGAVLETGTKNSVDEEKLAVSIATEKTKKDIPTAESFSLSVEVDQWASVTLARAQLLPKAMERCDKGFSLEREHYRPLAMGRIALSIEFICHE